MKHIKLWVIMLSMVLLLAACSSAAIPTQASSSSATTAATPSQIVTIAPTQQSIEPETTEALTITSSPAPTLIPVPTTSIIDGLPDPVEFWSSLNFDLKQYPRVDGSTANLPLGVYIRAVTTGQSLEACEKVTKFTTTGPSYIALARWETDLILAYEAPEEVKEDLAQMGAKLTMKPIGMDALVFLTNNSNPVKSLTHKQIVDIYTGRIKKWNRVGGDNIDIIPYQRISNSGSQALMLKLVMKGTQIMDAPTTLQPGSMSGLVDAIASYDNTRNALGYSVYYYVRNMYQMPGIKLLAVDGVAPTNETIASGKYPYINPFYAVIRVDEPKGSPAHQLFDWLTGEEGKRAIGEAGYVAVK